MSYQTPDLKVLDKSYKKVTGVGVSTDIKPFQVLRGFAISLQGNVNTLENNRKTQLAAVLALLDTLAVKSNSKDIQQLRESYNNETSEDVRNGINQAIEELETDILLSEKSFKNKLLEVAKTIHNELYEMDESSFQDKLPEALDICKGQMEQLSLFIKDTLAPDMSDISSQIKDIDSKLEERYGSTYFDRTLTLLPSKDTLSKIDFAELAALYATGGTSAAGEAIGQAAGEAVAKKEISKGSQAAVISAVYETATSFIKELSEQTKFYKRISEREELQERYNKLKEEYYEIMKDYRKYEQTAKDLVALEVISTESMEYGKQMRILEDSLKQAVAAFEQTESNFKSTLDDGSFVKTVNEFQTYLNSLQLIWQ